MQSRGGDRSGDVQRTLIVALMVRYTVVPPTSQNVVQCVLSDRRYMGYYQTDDIWDTIRQAIYGVGIDSYNICKSHPLRSLSMYGVEEDGAWRK